MGTIAGTVIAAADNRPLDNVTVTLSLGNGATAGGDAGGFPATTKTDSSGAFSFGNEPIGSYTLTFARTGFTSKTVAVGNTVAGPTTLGVTLAADTTAGVDAPTFQLKVSSSNGATDPTVVGFGTTVTVSVDALTDPNEPSYDAASFSYAWKISTAPTMDNQKGAYTFATPPTSSSTSATFATMTLAQTKAVEAYGYNSPIPDAGPMGYVARLGVMGINPDETGRYTVSVTVSDPEGHNYTFSQGIESTWQTPNLRDVPVGVPVYVQGDTFAQPNWLQQGTSFWKWPNTSWAWTVVSAPQGSAVNTAALGDANTQFPHFTPDVTGDYVLQVVESSSYADAGATGLGLDAGPGPGGSYGTQTSQITVHAGTWLGIMNGNNTTCILCHKDTGLAPDMFTPWQNTAHASALQRKLDGLAAGNHFGESCMECHTTGWSETATAQTGANNGFYYVMNTERGPDGGTWEFPTNNLKPGTYQNLVSNYPDLAKLAGIQCENCHGPAAGPATNHTPGSLENEYRSARIDWSAQLCASCHQENWNHNFPGQWGPSPHGNVQLAQQRATVESKATAYGGGADPQGGAQHCARCHSAQGFAEYVDMLNNGASGRYDFITTDDQKLAADKSNAPTAAYLSGLGLNAKDVQSQTCQTCHDPHSNQAYGAASVDCTQQANNGNPACMQLRIYDGLPNGLPNGQAAFSGVGAGAICMACHNGRNGEHTDFTNSSPYAETPHDSTATEALFGYNAFWVPRYSPSPHMAIKDTCVGCHMLPTAEETAAGLKVNHAFETDLTICQNCHGSSNIDGAAIQKQVASELAQMSSAITSAVTTAVKNANAAGPLCVRVVSISDPKCTGGSCASTQVPTAVPYPLAPSNVEIPQNGIASVTMASGGTTSVTINLVNGLSFPYFDPQTLAQVGTTNATKKLSVSITTIENGSCSASPPYMFPPSDYRAKAIWNYVTLSNEGSGGLHNLPWTNAVISATMQHLQAGN